MKSLKVCSFYLNLHYMAIMFLKSLYVQNSLYIELPTLIPCQKSHPCTLFSSLVGHWNTPVPLFPTLKYHIFSQNNTYACNKKRKKPKSQEPLQQFKHISFKKKKEIFSKAYFKGVKLRTTLCKAYLRCGPFQGIYVFEKKSKENTFTKKKLL